jgi:ElaB/YqjD/DUF883 family membrane-anchored ribosome-binding protein
MIMLFLAKPWKLVYENAGEGGAGGEGNSGNEGATGATPKPKLSELIERHGLQDELNSMMANNRKSLQQKNQQLIDQLQQLRETATMSTQAKEELEARIEELQTQYMSKEEIAKREADKLSKQYAKDIEKLTGETKKWQSLYTSSTTQRALMDAAVAGEALPQAVAQICAILGPRTHIVEDLDASGQGKGTFSPVVKFDDTDSDGNPVVLDLTPKKAIERMKELPEQYGNLFKGDNAGGLGEGNAGLRGERAPKLNDILSDPAKYQEWRKKNPDLDISKLRK